MTARNSLLLPAAIFASLSLFLAPRAARAADPPESETEATKPPADKSGFTLLDRTPDDLLRPLSTDRPDKTDTPLTVDAGHFQLEMDFLSYTYNRPRRENDETRSDGYNFLNANLKVGLLDNTDLELIVPVWRELDADEVTTGQRVHAAGFGDLTLRIKLNLWGNDGGITAVAIMPFVKFPTASPKLGDGDFEGGLEIPIAVDVPWGFDLGFNAIVSAQSSGGSNYYANFGASCSIGYTIADRLRFYVEIVPSVNTEPHTAPPITLDGGVSLKLTSEIQLDGGVNVGLTKSADELNPFVGISIRY